jgi:beta-lactamase superfamily II metal-dependent hydrolase
MPPQTTNYEIDFLPVGTGEKSGDAIALRVWNNTGQQVFVIDGGTKEAGKMLVQHIRTFYGTNVVNGVISTHPDGDHASGLSEVLENMDVKYLLMHQPWDHAPDIKAAFETRALTNFGLQRKMKEELVYAHELKKIADRKKIPIFEPFEGTGWTDGLFSVLGPSQTYYQSLLPQFRDMPEVKEEIGLFPGLIKKAEEKIEMVAEAFNIETLTDGNEHFSAENNTSTILLFNLGQDKVLFTGDADADALTLAADYAARNNISLTDLKILQVPHHGSKQNVGPTILNRIKAPTAHISVSPGAAPKHPSKKVVNALSRRGTRVFTNGPGQLACYRSANVPARQGWFDLTPHPFYNEVEV